MLRTVGLVFALYAVQGIPFGFIDNFLPIVAYKHLGTDLQSIGLLGTIGLPWMFKWLWAPLVDAYWSPRIGQYKSWIIPAHVAMLFCCMACSCTSLDDALSFQLVASLLLWALATAVEDIAVDGFAIACISEYKNRAGSGWLLGLANFAQVVGFKFGVMYASGPLWWVHEQYGWQAVWGFMAAPVIFACFFAISSREPQKCADRGEDVGRTNLKDVLLDAAQALGEAEVRQLMALTASYKVGEKVLLGMFKPYLIDQGYDSRLIGEWSGYWGTLMSIVGSTLGSALLVTESATSALFQTISFRAVLFALSVIVPMLTWFSPQLSIILMGLGSGLVTPVMFGYLMDAVKDSQCAVTRYTLLQCCDDLSRLLGQAVAGVIAQNFGYVATFAFAITMSGVPLFLCPRSSTSTSASKSQ